MQTSVDWKFFIDKTFLLQGSDYSTSREENGIRFLLDGKTYLAIEDDEDDLRSCCRDVVVLKRGTFEPIKNRFRGIRVTGRWSEKRFSDVVELVENRGGNVIIEFGTDNTDNYYPSFVGNFWPDRMYRNRNVKRE